MKISVKDVSREMKSNIILNNINLQFESGKIYGLCGHNGSGKSTLAKHINALLAPSDGTIWVDGMDVSKEENVIPVRKSAGMVFQNPDNQIIRQCRGGGCGLWT